ncbi:MAG: hypothetical protein ACREN8_03655, partial [Candidatus Dormibacteraceae bacterium]
MSSYAEGGARNGGFRGERHRPSGGQGEFRNDREPRRPYGGPALDYQGLVEFVAKSVAEKPDEVKVTAMDRGRGALAVRIKVAD